MSPIKQSSPKSPGKQHALELKRVHQAAGLLTTIFGQGLAASKNTSQQNRLHKVLLAIIGTDTLHAPGQRVVSAGDVRLLEGFEFFTDHTLQQELPLQPQVHVDRQKGYCVVHIPPIQPSALPKNRLPFTHFLPSAEVVAIHFEHDTARSFATATPPQALDAPSPLNLFIPFSTDSQATLVVAIGLRFLKEKEGTLNEMKQENEPLQIVKVDAGSQSGVGSQESGDKRRASGLQGQKSGFGSQESEVQREESGFESLPPDNRQQVPCRQGRKINVVPLKAILGEKAIKKATSKKKSKGRKAVPK